MKLQGELGSGATSTTGEFRVKRALISSSYDLHNVNRERLLFSSDMIRVKEKTKTASHFNVLVLLT